MPGRSFPDEFDFHLPIGPDEGNQAFFGRNVLDGLVRGIDDFIQQPRWGPRSYRTGPAALLACSPWVNDDHLLAAIEQLPAACIVLGKPRRRQQDSIGFRRLRALNESTNGIELKALPGLGDIARKVEGRPRVIGPYDRIHEEGESLATFRLIGFRATNEHPQPPVAHAKLALLGNISWTDEHPAGFAEDYVWFSARRLWVSSANFTRQSRESIEFGYWTEQEDLVSAVETFLVNLIGGSEDLDSAADEFDPEMARIEIDDAAMAEAAGDWTQGRVDENLYDDEG